MNGINIFHGVIEICKNCNTEIVTTGGLLSRHVIKINLVIFTKMNVVCGNCNARSEAVSYIYCQ